MTEFTAFSEAKDIVSKLMNEKGIDVVDVDNDEQNQVLTIAADEESIVEDVVRTLLEMGGNFGLRMSETQGYPVAKIYKDTDKKMPYITFYSLVFGFSSDKIQSIIDTSDEFVDDLRSPAEVRIGIMTTIRIVDELEYADDDSDVVSFEELNVLSEDDIEDVYDIYKNVAERMKDS